MSRSGLNVKVLRLDCQYPDDIELIIWVVSCECEVLRQQREGQQRFLSCKRSASFTIAERLSALQGHGGGQELRLEGRSQALKHLVCVQRSATDYETII